MYTAPINPAVMMGRMTANDPTQQAAESGDFAAMLMQMLGGQAGEADTMGGLLGDGDDAQYLQQLLAQYGVADEQAEQDATTNAMEMLSALFAATPADVNLTQSPMDYQGSSTQSAVAAATLQRVAALGIPTAQQADYTVNGETAFTEQLASLAQTATPEQLASFVQTATPEQLASFVQTATPEQLASLTQQPAVTSQAGQTQVQQPNTTTDKQAAPKNTNTVVLGTREVKVEVESKPTGTVPAHKTDTRELDPLLSAYNRLYGIQKSSDAGSKPAESPDLEAIQQAVDSGRYLNPSVATLREAAAASEQVTPRDIASQVQSGIIANLDSEQKEFVIKLRPEGLGNITVKMVENDGKISLSIITSTQQAQSALSSEISSLREALRPFNAEITQLVANEMSFAQQQGMNEQRREGYQGEQHRAGRFWEPEDTTTPEQLHEYAQHVTSALGTRI